MKKLLASFLSLIMCFAILTSTAVADFTVSQDPIQSEMFPSKSYLENYSEYLVLDDDTLASFEKGYSYSLTDIEAIIEKNFSNTEKYFTPKAKKTALELSETAKKILNLSSDSKTSGKASKRSYFDENWYLLREGNYIETILDLDEGLSSSDITSIFYYGTLAKSYSEDAYPNDENKQDAYRHFTWNYLVAKNMSTTKARTACVNHEWGRALITPMSNYYTSQYNDYIDQGYTDQEAASEALADTVSYMPVYKYNSVCFCEYSLSNFKTFFDKDDYIMDFWNNCYGRAYKSYSSHSTAWSAAYSNIILHPDDVTSTHYSNVWNWDWYSY